MANMAKDNNINIDDFRGIVLSWYDKHQRTLPWRMSTKAKSKGQTPNPYHVWLSEIMLQQTTVPTVGKYFEKFTTIWPTIEDLANADRGHVMQEWAGLGYYARARNLHKCAKVVCEEYDGVFPETQKALESLPGIGAYTSAAIRAIAFDKPANVVDGNIERIMARIFAIETPMPDSKKLLKEKAGLLSDEREDRSGDYAQALMDIGSGVCTPKNPKCSLCPIKSFCLAKEKGIETVLPKKKPKKVKPQKHGQAYWLTNKKGEVAFERRPETKMLGGMLGLPTSDWVLTDEKIKALKGCKNRKLYISHSFTHFDLRLDIYTTTHENGKNLPQKDLIWVPLSELDNIGLPTLFKKIVKLMK